MGVTLLASYVHHRFVMGIEKTEPYQYIVPFLVGILFGAGFSALIGLHSSLKEKEKKLKELASTDPLTGLPNRREIMNFLDFEFNRAKRNGTPLSVAVIDLDDFKFINDTYGHVAGDEVLKSLASLIRRNLRSTDMVGRFGGEEFVVVMPDTPLNTAVKVMERLRRVVEETYFEPIGSVSISVGVAQLREGDDVSNLLSRADGKLYQAKREGKNRVLAG
ncbi:GGDEF domain-containing protein [Hydrogenivirga sp. 128-5-R1-1]|uniref:GGDEF domain-containing protein n=1 Tax=Hydrogenivirga sp. 128-5-R1-1 TaxID=392423 RepID=UPI00015EF93F|nr:GGDEF domain-containing protein [Hydrogenivirga sp. 128-5-R1-1]EDP75288.1 Diguanylate cyclase/phosphodiesterase domain 1 (GGDEF) [Hydrogenivirga sp. 128-5-R1-1]